MVPRRVMYHEVDTDHQLMIARKVVGMNRGVTVLDVNDLPDAMEKARELKFDPYVHDSSLVDYISNLLLEREQYSRH